MRFNSSLDVGSLRRSDLLVCRSCHKRRVSSNSWKIKAHIVCISEGFRRCHLFTLGASWGRGLWSPYLYDWLYHRPINSGEVKLLCLMQPRKRYTRKWIYFNRRTLSLINMGARFLWTIWMMPGGCIHASPSTCTGTASSVIVIFTVWHCSNKKNKKILC